MDDTPIVRLPAGLVGGLTLFVIGWTGLLIPSLIREIRSTFDQSDAGMGVVYLAYAVAYAAGSFVGGALTERLGRRSVLAGAALAHGLGLAGLGLAPEWAVFVGAAMVAGAGAGCLDGGANGVVLDVYREGRGRAMNLLHLTFSVGALAAPLVFGALVAGGVPWQPLVVATGVAVWVLVPGYLLVPMPSGRKSRVARGTGHVPGPRLLSGPLLLLGVAIAMYVAAEIGVSNWIVRFLEPAPIQTATLALSLYWAGLAVGRLLSSAVADRFDHLRFTIACTTAMAALLVVAILIPSLPGSIVAFGIAGVASGPVFPMIVAIGGERYPERSAGVGGALTGMAVAGSTLYPPAMGFLSVTVGLTVAMLGTAVLGGAAALALVAFGRTAHRRPANGSSADRSDRPRVGDRGRSFDR
jgi:fucose permease